GVSDFPASSAVQQRPCSRLLTPRFNLSIPATGRHSCLNNVCSTQTFSYLPQSMRFFTTLGYPEV
ncbi:unnamed protein product, partial [Amoebophrya sp. A120]